jgi:trehalose synthase
MMIAQTSDLWWKNAVFYCLDVETFFDSNGDGIGDFRGLTERIDYLSGIGITCLWLMPFYPSPNRDDGYDVVDYYTVDPRLGTLGEFVEFVRTARDRGIRVIVDLVVNHTSNQHPWFQAARADRDSPYREFYIWRDEPPEQESSKPVFPDAEDSIWSWDEAAGQYYLHHFYSHQPDLNFSHPAVRDEIAKIVSFWLQLGVSGFRVDAVPFLVDSKAMPKGVDIDPHGFLTDMRAYMSRRQGDAILMGEVNLKPEDTAKYFGDETADQLHMCLDFLLNQAMYLALARQDARPLIQMLRALPAIPSDDQWANFVRNHDELTLDKLSDAERQEVFAAFGPDPEMQIFGRGLRRRLPPMLEGDPARIRLAYSLMFSLPGTPVLFYGEEIGMAENLAIEGRMSVRAPMQWSDGPNGGFSTAPHEKLRRPVVEGDYGPSAINVSSQRRDPDSLLNWMERLIRRRKECPELGWGSWRLIETAEPALLAHRRDWEGRTVIVLHNLSAAPCRARLTIDDAEGWNGVTDLLGMRDDPSLQGRKLEVELSGYGYCWLGARQAGQRILV